MSDCEADHGPCQPAEFAVSLMESESPSNIALLCSPCVLAWLPSISAGEHWVISRA